ncbi:MAG: 2-oxoacid:acceptor oxidoreductase family protein [Thermodesulfobacteriota bacterium]
MKHIYQIRFSGFGGQGVVLAGLLLGQAGTIEGKYVAGSNSYGAQARGSGCKSEIVLSEHPIDFPHLIGPDILVAMSQGAYDLYAKEVQKESGLILYDQGLVISKEDLKVKQIGLNATHLAIQRLKNKQVANMVFLGALIELTRIVSPKALRKAISMHVAERFRPLNLKAFQLGMIAGRKLHG